MISGFYLITLRISVELRMPQAVYRGVRDREKCIKDNKKSTYNICKYKLASKSASIVQGNH